MKINDFFSKLKSGTNEQAFCLRAFRAFFGPGTAEHLEDCAESQKLGRDWKLILKDGRIIYLDTKLREKDYPDVLLEYISADTVKSPGWIEKDLEIDFMLYGFLPTSRCLLFPWKGLRDTWKRNGEEWKRRRPTVMAPNWGYRTFSKAIPTKELLAEVPGSMEIQLSTMD